MAPGNGALVSKVEKDGWTTWNWHARSSTRTARCSTSARTRCWKATTRAASATPSRCASTTSRRGREGRRAVRANFRRRSISGRDVIGPYPWADQKMGVIRVPFSGLENQTLIGYSERLSEDGVRLGLAAEPRVRARVVREPALGRQLRRPVAARGARLVRAAAARRVSRRRARLHGAARSRSAPASATSSRSSPGRERAEKEVYADPTGPRGDIYPKGSWVAHTLRKLIGDEAFFKSIRTLRLRPARSEAGQLHAAVRHDAGLSEDRERRHRQGLQVVLRRLLSIAPRCRSSWSTRESGKLKVRWQVPDNLPFPMPLDVRIDGKVVTLPMTDGTGETPAGERSASRSIRIRKSCCSRTRSMRFRHGRMRSENRA